MFNKGLRAKRAAVEIFQHASNPRTDGLDFIDTTLDDLDRQEAGVHPWHLPNPVLQQLAEAAVAHANDYTSELLLEKGKPTSGIVRRLPADVTAFAYVLSQNAARQMTALKHMMPSQVTVVFDEQTRADLSAEAMMPLWPRVSKDGLVESWQGRDMPVVSQGFLRAMIAAGGALEAETDNLIRRISDPGKMAAAVPPEYEAMKLVVGDIMASAAVDLSDAGELIGEGDDRVSQLVVASAYEGVHTGYIKIMDALIGSVCPPVLGEDFLPVR